MRSSEECGVAFSNEIRVEEYNVDPGWLESTSAIRKGSPVAGKTRITTVFVVGAVKSFAMLSTRDRRSGNSEETMPINRRETSTERRIFPILVRVDMILQPVNHVILILNPIEYCQK